MSIWVNKGKAGDGGFIIEGNIHVASRELEALLLIARGHSNEEAGKKLGVSVNTVRNHVYNVASKLSVRNRAEAIVKAIENGMMYVIKDKSLLGWSPDDFVCCMFCGRALLFDEAIAVEQEPMVINHVRYDNLPPRLYYPYEDCGEEIIVIAWREVKAAHPEYPDVPKRGVVYDIPYPSAKVGENE